MMQIENQINHNGFASFHNYPAASQMDSDVGVETAFAAVLFADIKGFTRFCQNVDLHTAFDTLSRFHQRMADVISLYPRAITAHAGDEVMVAWCGKPSIVTTKALQCGFAMLESVRDWNDEDFSLGHVLNIGIGIHSGPVALGRLPGTPHGQDSVFGDTVNIANRLERMTRVYSANLIASDEVIQAMSVLTPPAVNPYRFRPAIPARIRDRSGLLPIRIAM